MERDVSNQIDIGQVRRGVVIVAALGIAAAIIIVVTTFNKQTLEALYQINPVFLFCAICSLIISWIFSGLPFYVLAGIIGRPIGFSSSLLVYLAGSFFGFITPFGSGLLPTQVFVLSKKGLTVGQATAVTSARVTVSSWLFVALGTTIYLLFGEALPKIAVKILISIVLLAATWSILILFFVKKPESAKQTIKQVSGFRIFTRKFGDSKIDHIRGRLFGEIDYLSNNLKDIFSQTNALGLFLVFMFEIVAWLALFAVLPLVLYGFSVNENFVQLIFRLFILFSLAPVSPTPGGSGIVEIGFAALLSDLIPHHIVGLVILLWRAITYYLTLGVSGLVLLRFLATLSLKSGTQN